MSQGRNLDWARIGQERLRYRRDAESKVVPRKVVVDPNYRYDLLSKPTPYDLEVLEKIRQEKLAKAAEKESSDEED